MDFYCRKRDSEQAIWRWLETEAGRREAPWLLVELVDRDRVLTNPDDARRTLDWLRGQCFRDDEPGSARTPIVFEDIDGEPVAVPAVAA
jgi:hypothetical protein